MKENMLLTNENETCNKARMFAPISEKMWRKWAPKEQESPNPVLFQTKSSHKEPFAIPKESQYTTNLRPLTHRPRETKREAIQNRCKSVTPSPYPLLTPRTLPLPLDLQPQGELSSGFSHTITSSSSSSAIRAEETSGPQSPSKIVPGDLLLDSTHLTESVSSNCETVGR